MLKMFQSLSTVTRDQIQSQAAWNANVVFLYTPASPPTRTTRWRDEYFICSVTVAQLLAGMHLVGGRDANLSGGICRMARVDALPGPPSVNHAQPSLDKLVKFANKRLTNMPYRNLLLQSCSYGTVCGGLELNAALNESRTHGQHLLGQQAAPGLAGSAVGTGDPSLLRRLTLLPASSAAASRPANLGGAARPWRAALRAAAAGQLGRTRRHLGIAPAKGNRVRACIDLGLLTISAVLEAIT